MNETAKYEANALLGSFTIRCAFCFRPQSAVPKLVMGSFCGICSDCIAECLKVLAEDVAAEAANETPKTTNAR